MTQHVICTWLYSGGRATIAARGAAFHSRWGRGGGGGGGGRGGSHVPLTYVDVVKLFCA